MIEINSQIEIYYINLIFINTYYTCPNPEYLTKEFRKEEGSESNTSLKKVFS